MLKYIIILLTIKTSFAFQSGDVILISLNCYMCSTIESEGDGKFSHSGLLIKQQNQTYVLQALGKLEIIELSQFLKLVRPGGDVAIYRPAEFQFSRPSNRELLHTFQEKYVHKEFDGYYLWDDEKLYCSEFVVKFLNEFLSKKIQPKPMSFENNLEIWEQYYQGNVPHGKPGFSPNDFAKSKKFLRVNNLF